MQRITPPRRERRFMTSWGAPLKRVYAPTDLPPAVLARTSASRKAAVHSRRHSSDDVPGTVLDHAAEYAGFGSATETNKRYGFPFSTRGKPGFWWPSTSRPRWAMTPSAPIAAR